MVDEKITHPILYSTMQNNFSSNSAINHLFYHFSNKNCLNKHRSQEQESSWLTNSIEELILAYINNGHKWIIILKQVKSNTLESPISKSFKVSNLNPNIKCTSLLNIF